MKFFLHENFPYPARDLLRAFDGSAHEYDHSVDLYPPGTPDNECLVCLGKQIDRPTVIRFGGVLNKNAVTRALLREVGCRIVCFGDGWTKRMAWRDQAWKLIKFWPDIVAELEANEGIVIFDVSTSGKIHRTTL